VASGLESRAAVEHVEAQATVVKRSGSSDADLALLLLLVVGLNPAYLAHRIVPIHDTFYNFANFHVFLERVLLPPRPAHWYP